MKNTIVSLALVLSHLFAYCAWHSLLVPLSRADDAVVTIKFEHTRRPRGGAPPTVDTASPDRKVVIKIQPDKTVRLFEAETDRALGPSITLKRKGVGFVISALGVSPDNKTIVTGTSNIHGDSGDVDVWDATTGEHIRTYTGPPFLGSVFRVRFSDDGKTIIIASGPTAS